MGFRLSRALAARPQRTHAPPLDARWSILADIRKNGPATGPAGRRVVDPCGYPQLRAMRPSGRPRPPRSSRRPRAIRPSGRPRTPRSSRRPRAMRPSGRPRPARSYRPPRPGRSSRPGVADEFPGEVRRGGGRDPAGGGRPRRGRRAVRLPAPCRRDPRDPRAQRPLRPSPRPRGPGDDPAAVLDRTGQPAQRLVPARDLRSGLRPGLRGDGRPGGSPRRRRGTGAHPARRASTANRRG